MTPKHEHDCNACQLFAQTAECDWYVCPGRGQRSVICRHGSEGSNYASVPVAGYTATSPLFRAALALGLRLTDDEVRAIVAHILSHDIPMQTYQYVDLDSVGDAIIHSVLARPEGDSP